MRFIDLFAGLGGFHLALRHLGHECVFASELDPGLRALYTRNHGLEPAGDIRNVSVEEDIPPHDILCAGFPCQPFSKAGDQVGFDDPQSGDLFHYILDVLRFRQPRYFILENVANFQRHDYGRTWERAKRSLEMAHPRGYSVEIKKLSPHMFGIPQIRERVIIVGSSIGLDHFSWPDIMPDHPTTIASVLDHYPSDARQLTPQVREVLRVWQDFLNRYPPDEELPSFPIWSMEFGATYPFEETTPFALGPAGLRQFLGSHGVPLIGDTMDELMSKLPSYARTSEMRFPSWKIQFIKQNRTLYARHQEWIREWMPQVLPFAPSFQKFEWNCKGERRDLNDFVLQIRASGVRVKRPTTAPSLVAMTSTQVPIITWEGRYMTPRECARLQSMDELRFLPTTPTAAYRALGNAVNVRVVESVASSLLVDAPALVMRDEAL